MRADRPPNAAWLAIRLLFLMALCAVAGATCIAEFLVVQIYGYDHGFGEGERCAFGGAIIGAFIGLAIHVYLSQRER
jgi:hypothetical protein